MVCPKKLMKTARKWQRMVAIGRKTASSSRTNYEEIDLDSTSSSLVTTRGHFVIYTVDWKRFEMPLAYLGNDIFRELFRMSEEEFGVASDGPIILPCKSTFMDYVVSLIQGGLAKDTKQTLIESIVSRRCSCASLGNGNTGSKHLFVCG